MKLLLLLVFLSAALASSSDDGEVVRTYRRRAGPLKVEDADDRIPDHLMIRPSRTAKHQQNAEPPQATIKWLKPLVVGSTLILALAIITLSLCPPDSYLGNDPIASLSLWVFALPLGSIVACLLVAAVLQMVTLFWDKAAGVIRDSKFELIFLAILLFVILFSFAYINMVKAGRAQIVAEQNGTILGVVSGSSSYNMIASIKGVTDNIFLIVIVGDYLYICAEWLRKNHLTIFGFALLAASFYLLYALP